jgi:predicted N-acetyltransferase YhbS
MPVILRPATADDAPESGRICYEAFRAIAAAHSFPPDFPSVEFAQMVLRSMLGQSNVFGVVAERDGRIVGSGLVTNGGAIAGVGPITVDPEAQDGGVGRQIMQRLLELCAERDFVGVRLVQAAYHCRSMSLYAKLGFAVREPLVCMEGVPPGLRMQGFGVRPATAADLEACNIVCFRVHGHIRQAELSEAVAQGSATVVERDGRITGYLTALAFFGHAVAETRLDLQALIAASTAILGPGFLLPSRDDELLRWCLGLGLRITQPLSLMSLGLYATPNGSYLPSVIY